MICRSASYFCSSSMIWMIWLDCPSSNAPCDCALWLLLLTLLRLLSHLRLIAMSWLRYHPVPSIDESMQTIGVPKNYAAPAPSPQPQQQQQWGAYGQPQQQVYPQQQAYPQQQTYPPTSPGLPHAQQTSPSPIASPLVSEQRRDRAGPGTSLVTDLLLSGASALSSM